MRAGGGGPARSVATTGAPVVVANDVPPSVGEVLTAISATAAEWRTPGGADADLVVRPGSATGAANDTADVGLLDASAGAFVFPIPNPAPRPGRPLTLTRVSGGANAPTVVSAVGTIRGEASWVPLVAKESVDVVADGSTNWSGR